MAKITKLFPDLEFTGLHKNTTPISIGIVSECGKKFYAEFNDYDKSQCDEWINENVIKNLMFNEFLHYSDIDEETQTTYFKHNKEVVKLALKEWLSQFKHIEFWVDCGVWDWLIFVDLIMEGDTMRNIPKNFTTAQPFDVFTMLKVKGINPKEQRHKLLGLELECKRHNALFDAEITKQIYERFSNMG